MCIRDRLSKLEKDLLASYIRDLYEILIDEKVNDADRLQNRRIKSDFGGTQAPPQPTEIPIVKEEPKAEESKPIMEEVRVHEENVIKPEPRQEVVVIREEPKPIQETVIRNDIKQDVQELSLIHIYSLPMQDWLPVLPVLFVLKSLSEFAKVSSTVSVEETVFATFFDSNSALTWLIF